MVGLMPTCTLAFLENNSSTCTNAASAILASLRHTLHPVNKRARQAGPSVKKFQLKIRSGELGLREERFLIYA